MTNEKNCYKVGFQTETPGEVRQRNDNQVRLQLFAIAYNIGNFLRRLALPKQIKDWSLRTMRERLIKIGAKVVSHARYVTFQMAEVLASKRLFQEILEPIHRLKPAPIGYG